MHSKVIFWINIPKNRSTFDANNPYSEKTVLLIQNSKTQNAHQFQFSSLDFALYRSIFIVYSKTVFFGSILSDIYSINFVTFLGEWIFQYSIKRNKSFFFFFCSVGVQDQWNKVIMHLTVRLLIQIPRFKS